MSDPRLMWILGYQAARKQAAQIASNACLVPPDGGSPSEEEVAVSDEAARRILAMHPMEDDIKSLAQNILDVRPHILLADEVLTAQITMAERLRAFGREDTWVNEKVAELRAEQEARK